MGSHKPSRTIFRLKTVIFFSIYIFSDLFYNTCLMIKSWDFQILCPVDDQRESHEEVEDVGSGCWTRNLLATSVWSFLPFFDTNMQHVTAICRNITVGHQRQQDVIKIRKWLITLNITLTELKGLFQVNKLKWHKWSINCFSPCVVCFIISLKWTITRVILGHNTQKNWKGQSSHPLDIAKNKIQGTISSSFRHFIAKIHNCHNSASRRLWIQLF